MDGIPFRLPAGVSRSSGGGETPSRKRFDEAREHAPYRAYGRTAHLEAELRKYILRQFAVFASEACKLGCQGVWSVERVEEAALEFLRLCTIEARSSKGFDRLGRAFGRDWIGNWGDIQSTVMREFERSDEWRQFQEELLHVAERQRMRASDAGGTVRQEIKDVPRDSAPSTRAPARDPIHWAERLAEIGSGTGAIFNRPSCANLSGLTNGDNFKKGCFK